MDKVFLQEDEDLVDIRIDGAFKAVFARETPESTGALSGLVSALIGRNVSIISILANEPAIDNTQDIQMRFDINCRAESGELVSVEMSLFPKPLERERMEYHVAKLFTGQDIRGTHRGYKDLKEAYQITILAKKSFFPDENFFHTFEYFDPVLMMPLNGRTRIISLELSKLEKIAAKPAGEMSIPERWAVYLEYLTDRSKRSKINEIAELEEGIAMASGVLVKVSRDEEERARIMRQEKTELDWISYMAYAKEEGHAEGLEKGLQETAKKALEEGASIDFVSKITGLDPETIRSL